jgi:hypothetical protein
MQLLQEVEIRSHGGAVERKGRDEARAYFGFRELYFLPTAVFSPQRSAFLSQIYLKSLLKCNFIPWLLLMTLSKHTT